MEAKTLNEHAEQIRQNHTTAVECERQAEEMGKEQGKQSIQAAIACGNNLKAAKKMLKHGEWLPWLAQNCPEISSDTCQRYMKLAKASYGMTDLTEKASLRQAYVATGVIKEKKPRTGAGSSSGERDKFSVENERARRLSKFLAVCDKATTQKMMDAVKPIVEWYNSQLLQIQKREAALNDGFELKEAA